MTDQKQWLTNYCIVESLLALMDAGVFEVLRQNQRWMTLEDIAEQTKSDLEILQALVEYLFIHTKVLEHKNGMYRLLEDSVQNVETDLSALSAYKSIFDNLDGLLRGRIVYGRDIIRDGKKLQKASHYFTSFATSLIINKLKQYKINSVVDLGCGSGALLIKCCEKISTLLGIGIEIDSATIKQARKSINRAGLHERIKVYPGDIQNTEALVKNLSIKERHVFIAMAVLHELFRDGEQAVVQFFTELRKHYSGSYFILVEFYALSPLFLKSSSDERLKRVASFYQLIHPLSAQGSPQPRSVWEVVFKKSGVTVEMVESTKNNLGVYTLKL